MSRDTIRISIEALWSNKLGKILDLLENVEGYAVVNSQPGKNSKTPEKLDFITQLSCLAGQEVKDKSRTLYYNLYGLKKLQYNLLLDQAENGLDKLYEELAPVPNYIIYLHQDPKGATLDNDPLEKEWEKCYSEYEYLLDNTHCNYPVFKINLEDSIENVLLTLVTIIKKLTYST